MFYDYVFWILLGIPLIVIAIIFYRIGQRNVYIKLVPLLKIIKFDDENFDCKDFANAHKRMLSKYEDYNNGINPHATLYTNSK